MRDVPVSATCAPAALQVWNISKFGKHLALLHSVETFAPTSNVAFSPDGKLLVCATECIVGVTSVS